jgi:chemotaxis protein CheZ
MSNSAPRKEFSVERMMRKQRVDTGDFLEEAQSGALLAGDGAAILEAIAALREEVRELKEMQVQAPTAPASGAAEPSSEMDEMARDVRIEIAQMVRVIAKTKQEISQIKHPFGNEGDKIERAHSELDAIVMATEQATQTILEATEKLEAGFSNLAVLAEEDQEMLEMVDNLNDQVTQILEACNFQDVTGQRITKVVKTVRFIEDRILAMISIWGAQAFEDLPVPSDAAGEEGAVDGDEDLLQGPQLGNEGISQDEIDALFD